MSRDPCQTTGKTHSRFHNTLQHIVDIKYAYLFLQVLDNELRKKIGTVQKLYEQAKGNLIDFSSQRKQLEEYISQMSAWLKSMEDTLVSSPTGSDPEDICRVKVFHLRILCLPFILNTYLTLFFPSHWLGDSKRAPKSTGKYWCHQRKPEHAM